MIIIQWNFVFSHTSLGTSLIGQAEKDKLLIQCDGIIFFKLFANGKIIIHTPQATNHQKQDTGIFSFYHTRYISLALHNFVHLIFFPTFFRKRNICSTK